MPTRRRARLSFTARRSFSSSPRSFAAFQMFLYMVSTYSGTTTMSWGPKLFTSPEKVRLMYTGFPHIYADRTPTVKPKVWCSGSVRTDEPVASTDEPATQRLRQAFMALRAMFLWVSMTPFGVPVVPEVKRMVQTSSGSVSTPSASRLAVLCSRTSGMSSMLRMRSAAPSAWSFCATSKYVPEQTRASAPQRRRSTLSSSGLWSLSSGTATFPLSTTANHVSIQ